MSKIYAVKNGHQTGIFNSWGECEKQVKGYSNAEFKSFSSFNLDEAHAYLNDRPVNTTNKDLSNNVVDILGDASDDIIKDVFEDNDIEIDHNDGQYHVYVDGSFVNGQYAWGFVVYHNDEEIYAANGIGDTPGMESMRNVSGEITAAKKAVEWAVENDVNIIIYHDYTGIASWAEGSWKTNNIHTMNYAEFMQQFKERYTMVKVKGHVGIIGNERADDLAKEALGIS